MLLHQISPPSCDLQDGRVQGARAKYIDVVGRERAAAQIEIVRLVSVLCELG